MNKSPLHQQAIINRTASSIQTDQKEKTSSLHHHGRQISISKSSSFWSCSGWLVYRYRGYSYLLLRRCAAGICTFNLDTTMTTSQTLMVLLTNLLQQPTEAPGLINTFVCNCFDCRKVTASMFASNFTVDNSYIRHLRGEDNLSRWGQDKTPTSGTEMANYFCKTCGTLMYRRSALSPEQSFLRIGTVDDFTLHETKLRPQYEIFTASRVNWWHGVEGAKTLPGPLSKASD